MYVPKVLRTQEGTHLSADYKVAPPVTKVPKFAKKISRITQKNALSAPVRDQTAVTSAINHFIFI